MKIKEIKAKSILVKSKLPEADFVINPYIGCQHGCKYCYARFMKRFTGHKEPWGEFIDVKVNAPNLIKTVKGNIVIGSTTDPYQPIEKKYKITRKILEKLVDINPNLNILTKSDLILRDIDILKKLNVVVSISLSSLDEKTRKKLENAPSSDRRIKALRELHKNGIKTVLFISPIFPKITDWKKMITKTKDFVDEYWFENLNLYPSIKDKVSKFLPKGFTSDYWIEEEKKIKKFCKGKVNFKIYFHHKSK